MILQVGVLSHYNFFFHPEIYFNLIIQYEHQTSRRFSIYVYRKLLQHAHHSRQSARYKSGTYIYSQLFIYKKQLSFIKKKKPAQALPRGQNSKPTTFWTEYFNLYIARSVRKWREKSFLCCKANQSGGCWGDTFIWGIYFWQFLTIMHRTRNAITEWLIRNTISNTACMTIN